MIISDTFWGRVALPCAYELEELWGINPVPWHQKFRCSWWLSSRPVEPTFEAHLRW